MIFIHISKTMLEKIPNVSSVTNFLRNHKEILKKVSDSQEAILLLNHNNPVCVMISVREYNRFTKNYKQLDDEKRVYKMLEEEKWMEHLRQNADFNDDGDLSDRATPE